MLSIGITEKNKNALTTRKIIQEAVKDAYRHVDSLEKLETFNLKELTAEEIAQDYNVLFLEIDEDVEFKNIERIREKGADLHLIMMCHSGVDPMELVKPSIRPSAISGVPVKKSRAAAALEEIGAMRKRNSGEKLHLRIDGEDKYIEYDRIKYFESEGKHMCAYADGINSALEWNGNFKELKERLPEDRFFHCQKSFMVNVDKVVQINGLDVVLEDGSMIMVSRDRKKELKEKLGERQGKKHE